MPLDRILNSSSIMEYVVNELNGCVELLILLEWIRFLFQFDAIRLRVMDRYSYWLEQK
jgi:hypothetical protein